MPSGASGARRAVQGLVRLGRVLGSPERIRRIVGDEIVAGGGFFFCAYLAQREPPLEFSDRIIRIASILSVW